MEKRVENHKRYLERINLYRGFGYDVEKERKFILEKSLPLYGNILEVGSGKGYFTVELAREGLRFISVDISKEEQRLAKLNLKYFGFDDLVDFMIEDAQALPFEDKSFDIIFSINTIHHLSDPMKVVDELIRLVSFEGKLVLSDLSKEGSKIIRKIHASQGRRHTAGGIHLSEIGAYCKNKGFRIEQHKTEFQDLLIAYHQII